MYQGNYAIVPYVVPGRYLTYVFSFTGGGLVYSESGEMGEFCVLCSGR